MSLVRAVAVRNSKGVMGDKMIWLIINALILAIGIILLTASDYFNRYAKYDDILQVLMCVGGFGFIIIFGISEGIRRYPFG